MAYERTRRIMDRMGIGEDAEVMELLSVYADEIEEAEPGAVNDIDAARRVAEGFCTD